MALIKYVTQSHRNRLFLWQGWLAVLGHHWLNYLSHIREHIPTVCTADGAAAVSEVSKSSVWRQTFTSCQRALSTSLQCSKTAGTVQSKTVGYLIRGEKKRLSDKRVRTEKADFLFPSMSLQLASLILCSCRQHKHWDPEDVDSLWGCLFLHSGCKTQA